ncbi:hypothetical protein [Psychromonas sp. KJ10-2]|uniref:hypothetical protein n=1 Tax=Psychromonas sp. KJ10-2 TaxID=3391822 RepID=UPI0039B39C8C
MSKWKFNNVKAESYEFENNTVEFTNGKDSFVVQFDTDIFHLDQRIEEHNVPQFKEKGWAARLGYIHRLQENLKVKKELYPDEPSKVPQKVINALVPVPDGEPSKEYIDNYIRAIKILNPPEKVKAIQRKVYFSDRTKLRDVLSERFKEGELTEAEKNKALQWRYEDVKGFSDVKETTKTTRWQWKITLNSK